MCACKPDRARINDIIYKYRIRWFFRIDCFEGRPMRRVSTDAIGVGVIGASPLNPGWAVAAHLPAIAAIPDYELRAVSTSRRESAEAASTAFGVPGFDDHREMIAHPGVDLVV